MMASNASCCKILFRAGSLFSFLSFSRFPSPLYLSLICFLRCLSVCLSTSLFSLCDLCISPAIHQSVYLIYLPIHIHILLNICQFIHFSIFYSILSFACFFVFFIPSHPFTHLCVSPLLDFFLLSLFPCFLSHNSILSLAFHILFIYYFLTSLTFFFFFPLSFTLPFYSSLPS